MTTNSKRCQKSWSMSDTSVTTLQPHQVEYKAEDLEGASHCLRDVYFFPGASACCNEALLIQARGLYQSGSGGEYSAAADGPDSETRGFTANQLAHLAEWTELTSFRDGIFDCFENLSPSCIWATFLSCCLIGQITEKLNVFSCKVCFDHRALINTKPLHVPYAPVGCHLGACLAGGAWEHPESSVHPVYFLLQLYLAALLPSDESAFPFSRLQQLLRRLQPQSW